MKWQLNGTIYFTFALLTHCCFTEDLEWDKQSEMPPMGPPSIVVDPVMYFIYVPRVEYDVLNLTCHRFLFSFPVLELF